MTPGAYQPSPIGWPHGSVHASPTSIAALAWEAMREASAVPFSAGIERSGEERWVECLPLLWDAVWQAASGQPPALAVPPPPNARQVLQRARREFLGLVGSTDQCVEVHEVARVLTALEQVQSALETDMLRPREEQSPPAGMELLIDVAHDLRSPLTSILFLSEALRAARGRPIGPTQERQLMLIYSAAFELSSMASDLTELGRGGDQLLEREPVPFSIESVLHSVHDIVRPIAEEKGVEVRLAQVPRQTRRGHPAALGRVLLNLLTNALRHTERGHVELAVQHLSLNRVEFAVLDTGPGVPREVIESLRGPFDLHAFARTRAFTSSGLGLAICRRLLTAMGSDLRVKSVSEAGSCFHFALELPLISGEVSVGFELSASGSVCDVLGEEAGETRPADAARRSDARREGEAPPPP